MNVEELGEKLWPHVGHDLAVRSDGEPGGITSLVCETCGRPVLTGGTPPEHRRLKPKPRQP